MNERKVVCLPCKGKGLFDTGIAILKCNWCNGTGNRMEPVYEFTLDELKALYKVIEYQYVEYDNREAHAAINKLMRYIK